jgi:alanine-glyoxylate transaminase/serine-glyoxylate transaminase/serine-pyruvate transaminase
MKSYEGRKSTRYFATPPTQLIRALHCALSGILSIPLEDRFAAHRISSLAVKRRLLSLGLRPVAIDPEFQSHALTAMFMPLGIDTKYVLTRMLEAGFYVAGGIHAELGPGYLRIGHMGVTVTDKANFTIGRALDALETVLGKAGRQAVTKVQTEYPKMVDKGLARL